MGELTLSFVVTIFVVALAIVSFSVGKDDAHSGFTRDCSLTGTYIIDNDTVIVCRVVKRSEAKPVERKPEEQSL